MPKYLIQGSYTAEGLRGVAKDKASGRKAVVNAAVKSLKGKVESFYFSFGAVDIVMIVEAPDNTVAAALALAVGASGVVKIRTTPLMSVDEIDQALAMQFKYRAPGE